MNKWLKENKIVSGIVLVLVIVLAITYFGKQSTQIGDMKETTPTTSKITWSETPGAFERHLQRRYNNPLFPVERRQISSEELAQARVKDDASKKDFISLYEALYPRANLFTKNTAISELSQALQETENLIELGAGTGGDLAKETLALETLESKLTNIMNSKLPQGADMLKQAYSLSVVARIPYLAQSKRPDTPILKTEELAALLSEDMATISTIGYVSRSFPDFKPNGDDVKKALDEGVKNGLDAGYAKEALDAWYSQK